MKVHFYEKVDPLYLSLGDQKSDVVIKISEGINIDTILSYSLDLYKNILKRNVA